MCYCEQLAMHGSSSLPVAKGSSLVQIYHLYYIENQPEQSYIWAMQLNEQTLQVLYIHWRHKDKALSLNHMCTGSRKQEVSEVVGVNA